MGPVCVEFASCHPFDAYNFEVAARVFECLWAHDLARRDLKSASCQVRSLKFNSVIIKNAFRTSQ